MCNPKLSVIIPVLNEVDNLRRLLPLLRRTFPTNTEFIVVDGGSTDGSRQFLQGSRVDWYACDPGRARQLNFGADRARGEYLYFLHADTFPPPGLIGWLDRLERENVPAACCRLRFDESGLIYRFLGWFTRLNWNCFRFGDQSLLVRRSLFHAAGGYDESRILLEDNALVVQLRRLAPFRVLPVHVITSARKYRVHGAVYLQLVYVLLYGLDQLGVSQKRLSWLYRRSLKVEPAWLHHADRVLQSRV